MTESTRVEIKLLTRSRSLLLPLPSSFWEVPNWPCKWCLWSCCVDDSEMSLNDPGNLFINFEVSVSDDPDLSLWSSDTIPLAETKPEIVDRSPPIEIFGASSWFFPVLAHAVRWTSGPEWEALLCCCTWGTMPPSTACDGLRGSMGNPEASSGWGLNFSLLLLDWTWLFLFCNRRFFKV